MFHFRKFLLHAFALATALCFGASPGMAQTGGVYGLSWSVIAGGGGTVTGGTFVINGTLGQPASGGPMLGGQYSLQAGFQVYPLAIQTPGAPLLTITHIAGGQARIAWAPETPGVVLQESASLSPANWTNSVSGPTNSVLVPALSPAKFYRLYKP